MVEQVRWALSSPAGRKRKVHELAARDVVDEPSEDIVATARAERAARKGFFARVGLFIRQVVAELKKVVTPTRRELLSYTGVVLVFVVIMMALVTGFDFGFGWLVALVFGNVELFSF
jgi:preprotein translocase subunit SecE